MLKSNSVPATLESQKNVKNSPVTVNLGDTLGSETSQFERFVLGTTEQAVTQKSPQTEYEKQRAKFVYRMKTEIINFATDPFIKTKEEEEKESVVAQTVSSTCASSAMLNTAAIKEAIQISKVNPIQEKTPSFNPIADLGLLRDRVILCQKDSPLSIAPDFMDQIEAKILAYQKHGYVVNRVQLVGGLKYTLHGFDYQTTLKLRESRFSKLKADIVMVYISFRKILQFDNAKDLTTSLLFINHTEVNNDVRIYYKSPEMTKSEPEKYTKIVFSPTEKPITICFALHPVHVVVLPLPNTAFFLTFTSDWKRECTNNSKKLKIAPSDPFEVGNVIMVEHKQENTESPDACPVACPVVESPVYTSAFFSASGPNNLEPNEDEDNLKLTDDEASLFTSTWGPVSPTK